MTQAQIAGGVLSPPGQPPKRGYRLQDFALTAVDGREIRPSDYRGRANLVLVFAGRSFAASKFLKEIAQCNGQLQTEDSQVIAVLHDVKQAASDLAKALDLPFPLLVDEDGSVHRQFGAAHHDGTSAPAIYITDRYGEVFGLFRTAIGQGLPNSAGILSWLSFINSQCPECEAPEWPL